MDDTQTPALPPQRRDDDPPGSEEYLRRRTKTAEVLDAGSGFITRIGKMTPAQAQTAVIIILTLFLLFLVVSRDGELSSECEAQRQAGERREANQADVFRAAIDSSDRKLDVTVSKLDAAIAALNTANVESRLNRQLSTDAVKQMTALATEAKQMLSTLEKLLLKFKMMEAPETVAAPRAKGATEPKN